MTFTTRPTLQGTFGMVSSTHWIASQSAMRVLERGGNAFDAAVAAAFVLHVVEPHLNGPGGEVTAIIATAEDPSPRVLAGQGPAPAGATIEHFTSLGIDVIPGSGPLAAAVPGAVDAWMLLLRDHGSQRLEDVLEPAIQYAAHGHPLLGRVCSTVASVQALFETDWPTSADLWLRGGRLPEEGSLFVNSTYARTLQRLVEEGRAAGTGREAQIDGARRAWSHGFVAEAVDAFSRQEFRDSSGERHGGLITGGDMAAFFASWEEPVARDWHGFTVAKVGPWSQGPVLLQTMSILDAMENPAALDPSTAEGIHAICESFKLAFADREAWYGEGGPVPLQSLLSTEYAHRRMRLITDRASTEVRPGSVDEREPRIAAYVRNQASGDSLPLDASLGEPTIAANGVVRGDTCHVDVVDRWGNMVSATPSGGWLQSSPTIPGLGFPLGSRMQMFWLEEGLQCSLAPGRRPRTTLTPTLVLRDGRPVLACGSPGGDQQDQWQLLFLLRHLIGGQSLQEAIDAPMWHTLSLPGSFYPRRVEPAVLVVEDRLDEDVLSALVAKGHEVRLSDGWSLGRLCAVSRDPSTGILAAGANPRGMQGYACGR
ncbi:MAG: gamma-glutamyltransferase [Actinomycetota bacterium]|nr:gamma-glutamyltransferase [Actinomycetota bacterium]